MASFFPLTLFHRQKTESSLKKFSVSHADFTLAGHCCVSAVAQICFDTHYFGRVMPPIIYSPLCYVESSVPANQLALAIPVSCFNLPGSRFLSVQKIFSPQP